MNVVITIETLLQQDYPHFKIIFVDDSSKDNTYQKVLDACGEYKKLMVLTKPNGGKASALNYGISKTKNDFVVCIDADTQLKPDAVTLSMKGWLLL
ncbi:MAG: glycosyltransferase family 2 protein [Parafilimonas sp.]